MSSSEWTLLLKGAKRLAERTAREATRGSSASGAAVAGPLWNLVASLADGAAAHASPPAADEDVPRERRRRRHADGARARSEADKRVLASHERRYVERDVPSSPTARVFGFAKLGVGLVGGVVSHSAKQVVGLAGPAVQGFSPIFQSPANAARLASTLARMRGAALKLGQMLSMQDDLPPELAAVLEQVRHGADIMPRAQLEKVLTGELGPGWREELLDFSEKPIASASIGQVHAARLRDGRQVAVKIQYPGVADSIHSDLDNLQRLVRMTNLLPPGLYVDQLVSVMRDELVMECDYNLEMSHYARMRDHLDAPIVHPQPLLHGDDILAVPDVMGELTSTRVLTTEFVPGTPLETVASMEQETRDRVALNLLRLTMREVFEFRFAQTDPNYGNFLYDAEDDVIYLIDFGAAIEYSPEFTARYLQLVDACARKDRQGVIDWSRELGFLDGTENEAMLEATAQAGFEVGMPFAEPGVYDFGATRMTERVRSHGMVQLEHRKVPPPKEAYSLHRKLSGAFLACIRLRARVDCHQLLQETKAYCKQRGDALV